MDLKKLRTQVIKNTEQVKLAVDRDFAFQIGRQIERARLHSGMTQEMLAKKVGTHQSSIARAESGSHLPSLSFLKKIADALDVSLNPPVFAFSHAAKNMTLEMVHVESGYYVTNGGKSYIGNSSRRSTETLQQE